MLRRLCLVLLLLIVPSAAFAWGAAAHRYITGRAIDLLPAELKSFFNHYRDEIVIRVNDPDTWRTAGWDDDPNHFVNFGLPELGDYPFAALPREHGAAIEKFGAAALRRVGLLPWREAEEFGNLRRAFEGFKRSNVHASSDTVLWAAVAAHYMQDAHQPFHATNNFDGQLTGQQGIHARFERNLFERFQSRLTVSPKPPRPIVNPRDAAFEALLASHQLVNPLLAADKEAMAGKDAYDDEYFEKFFTKVRSILERRVADSITATAAIIIGAWEQAGRPALKIEDPPPHPIQKVRTP